MLREALAMVRARVDDAATTPACWPDVAYALAALRETATMARDGRVDLLNDLERRALAAESTHDPQVLADLLQALKAFLNEEMDEALRMDAPIPEDPMQDPALSGRKTAAEADGFMKYSPTAAEEKPEPDADVAMNSRRVAAEADGFARYDDTGAAPNPELTTDEPPTKEGNMAANRMVTCEACGHDQALPTPPATPAKESAAPNEAHARITALEQENAQLKEAAAKAPDSAAAPTATLTEAERTELVQLRAGERKRQCLERATTLIADKEATGYVTAEELEAFPEAQWPILIEKWTGPAPVYGTGQRDMPAPTGAARPARKSAGDVFTEHFGQ